MTNAFIRTSLLVNFLASCSLTFLFTVSNPAVVVTEINAAQNLHFLSVQVGRVEFWPNWSVLLSSVMVFRLCHDRATRFYQAAVAVMTLVFIIDVIIIDFSEVQVKCCKQ